MPTTGSVYFQFLHNSGLESGGHIGTSSWLPAANLTSRASQLAGLELAT